MASMLAFIMPFIFSYLNPLRSTFDIYMAFLIGAVLDRRVHCRAFLNQLHVPNLSALLGYLRMRLPVMLR